MKLTRIILKDFLTFRELDYNFKDEPILVLGENLTDENQQNNGSGKSSMFAGIEYAITSTNSRGVRDTDIVTYGKDSSKVQLFASCDIRKEELHIVVNINLKGSNNIELLIKKDEKWKAPTVSNNEDRKKFILEWFAISKEDLFNYYIISEQRFTSFFKSSNTEKVALINRFSDTKIIQGIEKVDVSELEIKLSKKKTEIDQLEGKKQAAEEAIEKAKTIDHEQELKNKKKALNEDIVDINDEIDKVKESIGNNKNNIKGILEEDIPEEEESIIENEGKILVINESIEKSNTSLEDIKKDIKKAQQLVDDFVDTDWDAKRKKFEDKIDLTDDEHKGIEETKNKIKQRETKILEVIQGIDIKLSGPISCPKCKHEFIVGSDLSIDELKEKKKLTEGLKESNDKLLADNIEIKKQVDFSLSDLQKKISNINTKERAENESKNKFVKAVNELIDKKRPIEQEISEFRKQYEKANNFISKSKLNIDHYRLTIKDLKDKNNNNLIEIKNYETQIKSIEKEIENLILGNSKDLIKEQKGLLKAIVNDLDYESKKYDDIQLNITSRNEWADRFKKFKMYIANKSLTTISYHINRYMKDMGSNIFVELEGYKELASGNLKEEITAKVIRDGNERPFASFSGGEQARLFFAAILANRHMINQINPYGGLDFLSIDEVLDKADSLGIKSLMDSAKNINTPVMIISHVSEEELVGVNKLVIVKENGYSRIK